MLDMRQLAMNTHVLLMMLTDDVYSTKRIPEIVRSLPLLSSDRHLLHIGVDIKPTLLRDGNACARPIHVVHVNVDDHVTVVATICLRNDLSPVKRVCVDRWVTWCSRSPTVAPSTTYIGSTTMECPHATYSPRSSLAGDTPHTTTC